MIDILKQINNELKALDKKSSEIKLKISQKKSDGSTLNSNTTPRLIKNGSSTLKSNEDFSEDISSAKEKSDSEFEDISMDKTKTMTKKASVKNKPDGNNLNEKSKACLDFDSFQFKADEAAHVISSISGRNKRKFPISNSDKELPSQKLMSLDQKLQNPSDNDICIDNSVAGNLEEYKNAYISSLDDYKVRNTLTESSKLRESSGIVEIISTQDNVNVIQITENAKSEDVSFRVNNSKTNNQFFRQNSESPTTRNLSTISNTNLTSNEQMQTKSSSGKLVVNTKSPHIDLTDNPL